MISSDGGSTKLALFKGEPPGSQQAVGHKRVAFRTDGEGFLEFLSRLESSSLLDTSGMPLNAEDVVDHDKNLSRSILRIHMATTTK